VVQPRRAWAALDLPAADSTVVVSPAADFTVAAASAAVAADAAKSL